MGLSNDLCEARSFSCRLLNTHMFSIRGLRVSFPELKPWVRGLFHSPAVPSSLSVLECGVAGSAISRTACPICSTVRQVSESGCVNVSPVCPSCPSPPLLPVWMNVSSLSPWLSDFCAVQFSVSSGCFSFLNFCGPSFDCGRRHSVSPYASILAGSLITCFSNIQN